MRNGFDFSKILDPRKKKILCTGSLMTDYQILQISYFTENRMQKL